VAEEPREPDKPETTQEEPPPVSEAVRRALLTIADLRDATDKLERRRSTKKLQPPEEPPEIIP
jgi:hypothetical protein